MIVNGVGTDRKRRFVLSRKQQAICCNYLSIFPSAKQKQAVDFVVVE